MDAKQAILAGDVCLGIELGSTRIKAVLIGSDHTPIAAGDHSWENRYEDGYWTYALEQVWTGLRDAYANLARDVLDRYGLPLTRLRAMGISAMMHGYLAFDAQDRLLTPFRTWRNTTTEQAAAQLTELFGFNIPQRWSVAHLQQAVRNGEAHVKDIAFLTTLAGYVHYKLTGLKVIGIGDASGMFPIDSETCDFDAGMLARYDALTAQQPWKLRDLLPRVLCAGEDAGRLSAEGAKLLDPTGTLEPGAIVAPPEGDAGTGMTATNAVAPRTGNVSAGTSVFAMVVLEKALSRVYSEIDMVTTPSGKPVAMVHCNNCTNEINAWAQVFAGFMEAMGSKPDMGAIYTAMFATALRGEPDGGGLALYNYLSGEPITGMAEGRPLLVRAPQARLTFANLMRTQLLSALATLGLGLEILRAENAPMDKLLGHGGFFKTPVAGQRMLAAVAGVPVSVMETAGEGGPWGMALLAAYQARHASGQTLEAYLREDVFRGQQVTTVSPDSADVQGWQTFLARYRAGLTVERAAVEAIG